MKPCRVCGVGGCKRRPKALHVVEFEGHTRLVSFPYGRRLASLRPCLCTGHLRELLGLARAQSKDWSTGRDRIDVRFFWAAHPKHRPDL